jgi:2,3-bisphosphoglycerate-independent phosphoglycerate mutase
LTQKEFPEQGMKPLDLYYLTMTEYDKEFKGVHVIFNDSNLPMTMGEVLEGAGKKQIRIAETEKYPHVTFFFSGGRENPFIGQTNLMRNSPKVSTYDLQPEMSAAELRDALVPELEKEEVDFVCLNFANPDMVGHTGVFQAVVKAVETVDSCAESVVNVGLKHGYSFIIIADHGNADVMINEDGSPNTAHSTNLVPCILVDKDFHPMLADGKLGDVSPTILKLMGVDQPKEMTGVALF